MAASSIQVAVRIRPLSTTETLSLRPIHEATPFSGEGSLVSAPATSAYLSGRSSNALIHRVVKALDDRVLVFDPADSSPVAPFQRALLGPSVKKTKDVRFCFDQVFDESATQQTVFDGSAKELVPGVLDGFNSTVFAYGATGCGKTHTISGSPSQPGIIFMLMKDLFDRIEARKDDMTCDVTLSYLEIYNENIRDLLISNSPANLMLRENEGKVVVPGLTEQTPSSAEEVISMIIAANANRTVSATEANAVSSRSHAVLCVNVKQKGRTSGISEDYTMATLSIIDLAGSERASATKNRGERLLEGANINKSLLALGNCINALCDMRSLSKHVPYRDSKLTRLLKHSLGGNCRTLMIVCVSPSSHHYDESFNTLQYANRAKEIKTKITRNVMTVDRHVSQYVKIIYELRQELEARKKSDGEREKRLKDDFRASREKALAETDEAIERIRKAYEEAKGKIARLGNLKVRRSGLQATSAALSAWRNLALPASANNEDIDTSAIDHLSTSLDARLASLQSEIGQACNAKAMFEAVIASAARNVSSPSSTIASQFPEMARLANSELRNVKLQAEIAISQQAEEAQAQPCECMADLVRIATETEHKVRGKASLCSLDGDREKLESLAQKILAANANLFAGALQPRLAAMSSFQPSSNGTIANPLSPRKRTIANRSPVSITSSIDLPKPGKMTRPSLHMASLSPRVRKSPKKRVVSGSQMRSLAPRPSLKPSTSSGRMSIFGSSGVTTAARREEKKAVVWKDDAGEQLTEEHSKSMIEYTDTSTDTSSSTLVSAVNNSRTLLTQQPLRMSLLGKTSALSRRLGTHATSATIAEEGEDARPNFTTNNASIVSSDISNDASSSAADSSLASDTTTTGKSILGQSRLAAKSNAPPRYMALTASSGRRVSSIGPIRSSKSPRRLSSTDPANIIFPSSICTPHDGPASSVLGVSAPEDVTDSVRRAGRVLPAEVRPVGASDVISGKIFANNAPRLSGVNARIAAARARRESMAAANMAPPAYIGAASRSVDSPHDSGHFAGRASIRRT